MIPSTAANANNARKSPNFGSSAAATDTFTLLELRQTLAAGTPCMVSLAGRNGISVVVVTGFDAKTNTYTAVQSARARVAIPAAELETQFMVAGNRASAVVGSAS